MAVVPARCLVGRRHHCLCHQAGNQSITNLTSADRKTGSAIFYHLYTVHAAVCVHIHYCLCVRHRYLLLPEEKLSKRVEHGSAKWGDAASICKRYRDKRYTQNLILTQNFRMGLDCYKHKRNLNVLVVGGSGAGKSRAYAVVNIMQCNCSMVITDPKGELLRKTGGLLEREGYEVRVFDLINPETSFCYNPFAYVRDDKDVLKLINNLIRNTTRRERKAQIRFGRKVRLPCCRRLCCICYMRRRRKNRTSL